MTVDIQVAGVAPIYVGTGTDGALELLGYTRNGADVTHEALWLDVPGDQNGGDEGPPIDVQFLGEIARVRLELTKWDLTVAEKLARRFSDNVTLTTGTPAAAGTLMFAKGGHMRLLIRSAANPRNFWTAFPRNPIELNRGTKFSTLVCEFECHRDSDPLSDHYGVLDDDTDELT